MARNYERMAKVWEKTTKANPYDDNGVEVGSFEFKEWFGRTEYARDFLQYQFDGLNVSKCESKVVGRLFEATSDYDLKAQLLDWMEYEGIDENELKKAYNLAWWMENKTSFYLIEG